MALKSVLAGLTGWDRLILVILVLLILFSFMITGIQRKGAEVVAEGVDGILYRSPLGSPDRVSLDAALGPVVIEIDKDGVAVVEAPCPNKVCIRQGRISRTGEVVVCVPSRLIVRLTSAEEPAYDAISR